MMSITQSQTTGDSPDPLDDLTRLVVVDQIRQLKARYTRLLDSQQWDELASMFVPEARFTLAAFGDPIVFTSRQEWIDYITPLLGGGTTVHQVYQAEIEVVDANTASASWGMSDYVIPAPDSGRESFRGHGHYLEQYRRIDGSWRIVELQLTRLMLHRGLG